MAAALLACLLLEIFVFHFDYWESLRYAQDSSHELHLLQGLEELTNPEEPDETETEKERYYIVTDPEEAGFEITDLDEQVYSVTVKAGVVTDGSAQKGDVLPVQLRITDEANQYYRELAPREIVAGIPESAYIRTHLAGKSHKIAICFEADEGDILEVSQIAVNGRHAFSFSWLRFFLCFVVLQLAVLCGSHSSRMRTPLDLRVRWQRAVAAALLILQMTAMVLAGMGTRPDLNWKNRNRQLREYEELSVSLREGHTWLNEPVPSFLLEMENPYDYVARSQASSHAGMYYLSDTSLYNGHYYVYFGGTPAFLLFLPFLFLTGHVLPTWAAVILCSCLYCAAVMFFMEQLVKSYFPETSLGRYCILSAVFTAVSQAPYLTHFASTYTMPVIFGMMLGAFGLGCWLRADRCGKTPDRRWLAAGAVSMALIIGCRPQFAALVLFAFPVFAGRIRKGEFFRLRRDSLANTASVVIPYGAVTLLLLYYNQIRFGSMLDFGVSWLLTISDMTHRVVTPARNYMGLWLHLFQPPHIGTTFPFVKTIDWTTQFQGDLYIEPVLGGFFALYPVALPVFAVLGQKAQLKSRGVYGMAAMSLFLALVITEADVLIAGISQRYQADYAFLYMLGSVLVLLAAAKKRVPSMEEPETGRIQDQARTRNPDGTRSEDSSASDILRCLIQVLCVAAIVMAYFSLLSDDIYFSLRDCDPYHYYLIKYLFFVP